jgi:Na+-transporting NADH:ubiquinone oxidoreductase subunit NqrB
MLFKDVRDYQIAFLGSFLVLGIGTRDWTLRSQFIITIIFTCIVIQWLAEWITYTWQCKEKKDLILLNPLKMHSLRSAIITSLGLSLLLRTGSYTTAIAASVLAIFSKFIFKFRNKHFFNPANFGIISVLTFTSDAWVSPGQWGEDWWYVLLFTGAGGIVLKKVGRWDTTVYFLSFYALLEAIRNFTLGWTWDVFWHRLTSGSLLLFALFMLTDPRSIPDARISRLIWAGCIAGLTFILRNQFYLSASVFWALFILSPLTTILDYLWHSPRFSWERSQNQIRDNSSNQVLDRKAITLEKIQS